MFKLERTNLMNRSEKQIYPSYSYTNWMVLDQTYEYSRTQCYTSTRFIRIWSSCGVWISVNRQGRKRRCRNYCTMPTGQINSSECHPRRRGTKYQC